MKRLFTVLVLAFLVTNAKGQVIMSEDFEGNVFPPSGWTSYDVDGFGPDWSKFSFSISGKSSAGHSYDCGPSQEGWLVTKSIAIPNVGDFYMTFWSYNEYASDYVYNGIWVSTTGDNPATSLFTQIKELHPDSNEVTESWKPITVSLNAYKGSTIYIGFKYEGYCADVWYIDNIKVYDLTNFIEVTSIVSPVSGINLSNSEQVDVLITNHTNGSVSSVPLELRLDNALITTDYTTTIAASSQVVHSFSTNLDLSTAGDYLISVTATTSGDSLSKIVHNTVCSPILTFPWVVDYSSDPYGWDCWTNLDEDADGYGWNLDDDYAYSYGDYYILADNWLITPQIEISSIDEVLSFYAYGDHNDSLEVLISTSGRNPSDFITSLYAGYPRYGINIMKIPLTTYINQPIYIAFRHLGRSYLEIGGIMIYDTNNYVDVEVINILTPISGMGLTANEPVEITLRNNGKSPVTGFTLELEYIYNNGNPVTVTETYSSTIASNQQLTYILQNDLDLSAAGQYNINVTAIATNDLRASNNSASKYVNNVVCNPITQFPWRADFNYGGYGFECYKNVDEDLDGNAWNLYYSQAESRFSIYHSHVDNWLITPQITISPNDTVLSFTAAAYSSFVDYEILVSTNTNAVSDFTRIYMGYVASGGSNNESLSLSTYIGQTIYIAFRHKNGSQMVLGAVKIDDPSNIVDIELVSMITPDVSSNSFTNSEPVKISIRNNGGKPITGFTLVLRHNGMTIANPIYTDTIQVSQTVEYTFPVNLDLSAQGQHSIDISANVQNDIAMGNNYLSKTVYNMICLPVTSFPWIGDLSYYSSDCWRVADVDMDGYTWVFSSSSVYSNPSTSSPNDWFVTPELVLDAEYSLYLNVETYQWATAQFEVLISKTGPTLSGFSTVLEDVTLQAGDSKKLIIPLDDYNGESVWIAFRHYKGYFLRINSIAVREAPTYNPVQLYGFRNSDNTGSSSRGFVNFKSTSPDTLNRINNYSPNGSVLAGEYAKGYFYYYLKTTSNTFNFGTVSTDTWTEVSSKPINLAVDFVIDMAYDLKTDVMYALTYISGGFGADLVKVNLQTGATTVVGNCYPIQLLALACNSDGQLYGIDMGGDFYSINKTNANVSYIGSTGFSSNYTQTMSFDHYTGRLFYVFYRGNGNNSHNLIEIDPVTVQTYDYGVFAKDASITGLFTMFDVVSKTPVAGATNVAVDAIVSVTFNGDVTLNSSHNITINNVAVSATANGKVLTINHNVFNPLTTYEVNIPVGAIDGYNRVINWQFKTNSETGISAINKDENRIIIYPNPSNGNVNISVSENSSVKLVDVTGRIIATYNIDANSVLNINQAAGVYFVQVECKGKTSVHKVVVVN